MKCEVKKHWEGEYKWAGGRLIRDCPYGLDGLIDSLYKNKTFATSCP